LFVCMFQVSGLLPFLVTFSAVAGAKPAIEVRLQLPKTAWTFQPTGSAAPKSLPARSRGRRWRLERVSHGHLRNVRAQKNYSSKAFWRRAAKTTFVEFRSGQLGEATVYAGNSGTSGSAKHLSAWTPFRVDIQQRRLCPGSTGFPADRGEGPNVLPGR